MPLDEDSSINEDGAPAGAFGSSSKPSTITHQNFQHIVTKDLRKYLIIKVAYVIMSIWFKKGFVPKQRKINMFIELLF